MGNLFSNCEDCDKYIVAATAWQKKAELWESRARELDKQMDDVYKQVANLSKHKR